jgi:GR25 family glycosyltransferase involved in LPS biosynthesis
MIDFYCIHKENDPDTTEFLYDCIDSGKQFDINVIAFPGIYSKIHEIKDSYNLHVNPIGLTKIPRENNGVLGCFLSHFLLWKKCVELDNPIGILEYDAIFIKPIPSNILDCFDDYLNLDYTRHLYLNLNNQGDEYLKYIDIEKSNNLLIKTLEETNKNLNKNSLKYINNNHIKGAFGYILKPSGAKKLIDSTMKYGILPADIQINLFYCDIKYTSPSIVMLNPKSLIDRVKRSHTKNDRTSI